MKKRRLSNAARITDVQWNQVSVMTQRVEDDLDALSAISRLMTAPEQRTLAKAIHAMVVFRELADASKARATAEIAANKEGAAQ